MSRREKCSECDIRKWRTDIESVDLQGDFGAATLHALDHLEYEMHEYVEVNEDQEDNVNELLDAIERTMKLQLIKRRDADHG